MPFFMKCVYWGRLVENVFCVVSIENDCYSKVLSSCWRSIHCMIHLVAAAELNSFSTKLGATRLR